MSHAINKIKDALHPNKTKAPDDHHDPKNSSTTRDADTLHSTNQGIHDYNESNTGFHPDSNQVRSLASGADSARGVGGLTPTNTRAPGFQDDDLDAFSSSATAKGLVEDETRGEGLVDEQSRKDESDEVAGSGLSSAEDGTESRRYGDDEAGSGLDGVRVSGSTGSGPHGVESK